MERKEVMNVVYSSDDNYVQHAVTSIVSWHRIIKILKQ